MDGDPLIPGDEINHIFSVNIINDIIVSCKLISGISLTQNIAYQFLN